MIKIMANKNLLFLSYCNYFNRIIRRGKSLADYRSYPNVLISGERGVSFNPNDGVDTEHIVNWSANFFPDYCIVLNDDNTINSKWFVTDFVRTRQGQYKVTLKRDVLSDHFDEVINSPCFIEKGFVNDDNPLIFNKEDFNCNQIKKGEALLHDKSYCSWIVLYYDLNKKPDAQNGLKGQVASIEETYTEVNYTLATWPIYSRYHSSGYKRPTNKQFSVKATCNAGSNFFYLYLNSVIGLDENCNLTFPNNSNSNTAFSLKYKFSPVKTFNNYNTLIYAVKSELDTNKAAIASAMSSYKEELDNFDSFINWDNKIIKTSDNKFYRIHVILKESGTESETLSSGTLYDEFTNAFKSGGNFKSDWSGSFDGTFGGYISYDKYVIEAEPIANSVHTYNYDFTSCKDVQDAPYGVIALPYKPYGLDKGYKLYSLDYNVSVLIARQLCAAGVGPDKLIYDCQILPYCPLDLGATVYADGSISFNVLTDLQASDYTSIKDENNSEKCIALHPNSISFTKKIYTGLLVDIYADMKFANDNGKRLYKVENQCTFYRLVSPNYNGQFEFNRAKNRNFSYILVNCTYKPYQPYIHLAPIFNGLYGQDFGDARGLVCGGDFSFAMVSSKFEEYKLQNKNYQDIFNRQIENMDTNYTIDQNYRVVNASAGILTSMLAGIGGATLGHPAAAVGGGLGIVGSAVGGIGGYAQAQEKHKEARDYAIDIHNFQLDNVRALPNSLAKVDTLNDNNKIFPFIERYSCTDEEIEIFKKKLEFEGMTINAIGRIADYLDNLSSKTFIKGKMLRMENIVDDSHVLYAIYDEIAKGVFLSNE